MHPTKAGRALELIDRTEGVDPLGVLEASEEFDPSELDEIRLALLHADETASWSRTGSAGWFDALAHRLQPKETNR